MYGFIRKWLNYLAWVPLAIVEMLVTLFAYPTVPFVALFAIGKDHLPNWLKWYETPDNGVDGDDGHIKRWMWLTNWCDNHNLHQLGLYIRRVAWMWRNKMYNFSYHVTGRNVQLPVKFKGNPNVESNSLSTKGWVLLYNDEEWGFFCFLPWLRIGKYQFCLRCYLGWKMKGFERFNGIKQSERAMLAYFIGPFRVIKIK